SSERDLLSSPGELPPPAGSGGEPACDAPGERGHRAELVLAEGREGLPAQRLPGARGRDGELLQVLERVHAPSPGRDGRRAFRVLVRVGRTDRRIARHGSGPGPEGLEESIEERRVLHPLHQRGAEPQPDVLAVHQFHVAEGAVRVERVARTERKSLGPKAPAEARGVLDEVGRDGAHATGEASAGSSPPGRRALTVRRSSSSLRKQPSVSRTSSSSRWVAWSTTRARAQSSDSATPGTFPSLRRRRDGRPPRAPAGGVSG